MQSYKVSHKHSGDRYYVLASSSADAVERVTLQLGDVEGKEAWIAEGDDSTYQVKSGVVLDGSGKTVRSMDA